MVAPNKFLKTLNQIFSKRIVVTLDELFEVLKTNSRMTVFRWLLKMGYSSSYNHAGKYYTLSQIPRFDRHGLWHYQQISFSRYGTLKETVVYLIENSETGKTHEELEKLLRIRVHNTLLDLVNSKRIKREKVNLIYLYVHSDDIKSTHQIEGRLGYAAVDIVAQAKPISDLTVIEILVEAIRGSYMRISAVDIASKLVERGINVTTHQVESIFQKYNLKKTLD